MNDCNFKLKTLALARRKKICNNFLRKSWWFSHLHKIDESIHTQQGSTGLLLYLAWNRKKYPLRVLELISNFCSFGFAQHRLHNKFVKISEWKIKDIKFLPGYFEKYNFLYFSPLLSPQNPKGREGRGFEITNSPISPITWFPEYRRKSSEITSQ